MSVIRVLMIDLDMRTESTHRAMEMADTRLDIRSLLAFQASISLDLEEVTDWDHEWMRSMLCVDDGVSRFLKCSG